MARNRRYSRYDFALKTTAPASGSFLEKYKKWKSGEITVSYTQDSTSNPGELQIAYINPFGVESIDQSYQIVVSKRAMDALTTSLGDGASLGHEVLAAGEVGIITPFEPAKAHIHKPGTGDGVSQTSKVTGMTYKAKSGATSWTYPFGKTTATSGFLSRVKAVRAAAELKGNSASFTPERFYA